MSITRLKILAIDDEFAALTKMKAMLSTFGECEVATSGAQTIDLIREAIQEGKYFDLITIDIELPDIDGIALLSEILREEKQYNLCAVKLMVSASSTPSNVCRAKKQNCDGFLVKPIKKDILHQKLHTLGVLQKIR